MPQRVGTSVSDVPRPNANPAQPTNTVSTPVVANTAAGPVDGGNFEGVGNTKPTVDAAAVPASLNGVISSSSALNLDVLNREFNPHATSAVPGLGNYTTPEQMFQGKTIVPVRDILTKIVGQQSPQLAQALAALLPDASVLRTPTHQFDLGKNNKGKSQLGNRVVFYGGQTGEKDLDKAIQHYGNNNQRLIKVMAHLNDAGQGGNIEQIIQDGVLGYTHVGSYSSGSLDGKPAHIFSDWPADYGRLNDSNKHYNAQLLAIDYQGGVEKKIPQREQKAYKANADMWDAVLGAVVPFASNDPDQRYTNYKFNPLDGYDQASLKSIAESAASLNWDEFKNKHGAFYCAEGAYLVANLGPQDQTLLKKSKFPPDSKLAKLIEAFKGIPKDKPELGWQKAREQGLISPEQYNRLESTGRLATYMEWIPENTKGWQEYKPKEKDGLVATPMTVAGLAQTLFRAALPQEGLSQTFANALSEATKKTGGGEVIRSLIGGADPASAQGQAALKALGDKASAGLRANLLQSPQLRQMLLSKSGYDFIATPEDKKKVDDLYDQFVAMVDKSTNQKELDASFSKLDKELRNLRVSLKDLDGNVVPNRLMLYAAPQSYIPWAQNGAIAGTGNTGVFRYVATAMHEEQKAPVTQTPQSVPATTLNRTRVTP